MRRNARARDARTRSNRAASGQQWTRTQRIRTAAVVVFSTAIAETAEPPVYQQIADEATQLRELGISGRAIAQTLGVSDETVAKAIRLS